MHLHVVTMYDRPPLMKKTVTTTYEACGREREHAPSLLQQKVVRTFRQFELNAINAQPFDWSERIMRNKV